MNQHGRAHGEGGDGAELTLKCRVVQKHRRNLGFFTWRVLVDARDGVSEITEKDSKGRKGGEEVNGEHLIAEVDSWLLSSWLKSGPPAWSALSSWR